MIEDVRGLFLRIIQWGAEAKFSKSLHDQFRKAKGMRIIMVITISLATLSMQRNWIEFPE